jgi:hypothetical protein
MQQEVNLVPQNKLEAFQIEIKCGMPFEIFTPKSVINQTVIAQAGARNLHW